MNTLYESINVLCNEHGIKPGRMCIDLGISKSIITKLKLNQQKSLNSSTIQKIADYFSVSVDRVMGIEKESHIQEDIGPNKQKVLNLIDDLSETEAALLIERIQKIKESRV